MRRNVPLVAALLAFVLALVPLLPVPPAMAQEADGLDISSKHYIVVDADTGEVFAERAADDPVPIASLTKIFTSIEAIELAPGDREITTADADMVSSEATQMGFGPGETFPLDDLIYGMLLPSGNDAARAVARSLGAQPGDADPAQSLDRFMAQLNQRIRNMGLTQTNLVNPDGWGVPNHHSSARDLAAFMMYALQYPRFVRAISTETYETAGGYNLTNTNRLLDSYSGLVGGKTGYDDDAGYCLVEVAKRDGSTMISVTLDGVAPDIWYDDNRQLLDYAFARKAKRLATGAPIGAAIVRYRDPDAAIIAQSAVVGVSIGGSLDTAAPVPSAVPHPTAGEPPPAAAPGAPPPPSIDGSVAAASSTPPWLVPFAVAAALIASRTLAARRGARPSATGRRRPRLTRSPAGPPSVALDPATVTAEPAP